MPSLKRLVLLDLEETLIFDLLETNVRLGDGIIIELKINAIKQRILQAADDIGLMSWAVYNSDLADFNEQLRPRLEGGLERGFDPKWILSMEGWADLIFKESCLKVDRHDLYDVFHKEEVLFLMARKSRMFKDRHVLLVDDRIPHALKLDVPSNNCVVEFININDFVKGRLQ